MEDAVVAVIAEHGLEGTSVRRVAARAGVSIGAVQYHFPSKDAMLAAAMARVEEIYGRRLAEEAARLSDSPDMMLRATLRSLIPRSRAERVDTSLWLAFVARAAVHHPTAAQHQASWQRAEDGIAWQIMACIARATYTTNATTDGAKAQATAKAACAKASTAMDEARNDNSAPEPSPWVQDAAAELLALADGLAIASAIEPVRMPPVRARQILDAAVGRVLQAGPPHS
ncbi:TetR/AcrR family transcriptional regulator [Ornithinimicrobium sp. LYQ103]|uniref:TetR/AcrR family transcriptional regulator n=1 Tax=Ornithinimicrobium sp. LYQ121 TaxID=3378801 RepID=UPI0038555956